MRKIFYLLFVSVFVGAVLSVSAQTPELPFVDGRITYTAVVPVDNLLTKSDLYARARQWFAQTYKSASSVIQMDDKEAGAIVGKALMRVYHKGLGTHESGHINYTISVWVKDGRFKYEITNFYHTGQLVSAGSIPDYGSCEGMINTKKKMMGISYQKTFDFYLQQMNEGVTSLIADLTKTMSLPAAQTSNDDW